MRVKPADIQSKREGDAVTVAVTGEIDLSAADRLDTTLRDAEKTEIGRIVVDLSSLSLIDSSALAVLLDAIKRNRRRAGSRLSFVPSRHEAVTRLLALTDTTEIFQ
jgi:anti-sigma B factor antagonist